MSSYNLLNGTHTANNRELCTDIARCEWGYDGLIMSDWGTTNGGNCTADGCIRAGNDLVMPGTPKDIEEIRCALENGTLPRARALAQAPRVFWRLCERSPHKMIFRNRSKSLSKPPEALVLNRPTGGFWLHFFLFFFQRGLSTKKQRFPQFRRMQKTLF